MYQVFADRGFRMKCPSLIVLLLSTALAQTALQLPSPLEQTLAVCMLPLLNFLCLQCSVSSTTAQPFTLTISNQDPERPVDIYFKSFPERQCRIEMLFNLSARSSQTLEAFPQNR